VWKCLCGMSALSCFWVVAGPKIRSPRMDIRLFAARGTSTPPSNNVSGNVNGLAKDKPRTRNSGRGWKKRMDHMEAKGPERLCTAARLLRPGTPQLHHPIPHSAHHLNVAWGSSGPHRQTQCTLHAPDGGRG